MSSISTSALAICRWSWCKETFDTQDELAEHVMSEHVAKATPIKRKDLPLEQRARDGTSFEDSIRTSLFFNEDVFLSHDDKNDALAASHAGPSTIEDIPTSQIPPRQLTVSPSPGPGRFRALADDSSRSPDPAAMRLDASPSPAEMIANIINRANNSNAPASLFHQGQRRNILSPNSRARHRMRTGQPRSPQKNRLMESQATVPPIDITSSGEPSQNAPNVENAISTATIVEPGLFRSSVPPGSQSQTQSQSHARPFRTGAIRLEPSSQASGLLGTQSQTQSFSSALTPGLRNPQPTENIHVHDVDMLSSTLEPSLPAFGQALDERQSQWPVITQAPYGLDSQLSFDSQRINE